MKMKNLAIVVFLLFSSVALAQPAIVGKANAAYEGNEYSEATDLLVKAYERISPKNERALALKSELAYKAAYSFEKSYNTDKAIEWYQRAIDLKHHKDNPHVYFRMGNLYKKKGEYENARENYNAFLELVPTDQQAKNAIKSLDRAEVMKDNRTRYTVKSEFKINDEGMDIAPSISSRRGNSIVFASTRSAPVGSGKDPVTGEGFFNIWEVEMDRSGNWQPPKLFEADSINTEHNEGPMVFDGRFRNMFLTRCPRVDKKDLGCQIWSAEKRGRAWGLPKKLPLNKHDTISVGHPLPNEDGSILIFASDMPGGHGGRDLWYTKYERREESWTTPKNLGPKINTGGDEMFPTYAKNGDLFFSSTGHEGLGGQDIFRAKKEEGELNFGAPENMGTPINSDANDYHFVQMDSRNGFFTSNRDGSRGSRGLPDIWSYELPPNVFDLKVIVTEVGGTQRIDGATVQVSAKGGGSFKGVTNSDGVVYWDKKPNGDRFINEETDYTVQVLPKEGYHPSDVVETFSTVGLDYDQNFIVETSLLPKTPIVLPEVRYDLGSAALKVEEGVIDSKDSLNYVSELLEEYPGMVLKLVSHTDSRGSSRANEQLAQERAQSCVDYLVNTKGVNPDRLIPEGKGEDEPRVVYKKDSIYHPDPPGGEYEEIELTEKYINQFKSSDEELFEQLHQYNRRTEGEVVRMDYNSKEEEEGEGEESEE